MALPTQPGAVNLLSGDLTNDTIVSVTPSGPVSSQTTLRELRSFLGNALPIIEDRTTFINIGQAYAGNDLWVMGGNTLTPVGLRWLPTIVKGSRGLVTWVNEAGVFGGQPLLVDAGGSNLFTAGSPNYNCIAPVGTSIQWLCTSNVDGFSAFISLTGSMGFSG